VKAIRVLTEDKLTEQLFFGIQIGSLVCTCEAAILLKASAIIRKRIALLSAC
jgi:hypothetical protein